jgi:hypothetical protein
LSAFTESPPSHVRIDDRRRRAKPGQRAAAFVLRRTGAGDAITVERATHARADETAAPQ